LSLILYIDTPPTLARGLQSIINDKTSFNVIYRHITMGAIDP